MKAVSIYRVYPLYVDRQTRANSTHYENTPIQIYSKISPPKTESFQ